jgi:hypothetical protein
LKRALLFVVCCSPRILHAQCDVWQLSRSGREIALHSTPLESGRTEVLQPDGTSVVSAVVVQSEGQSADLVMPGTVSRLITRCQGDTLRVLVQRGDQPPREVMAMSMRELRGFRLTVHVTGGDGATARFRLDGWKTAVRESGPVIDLFQGRVPLPSNGHAITTVVERANDGSERSSALGGTATVRFDAGYPMVQLRTPTAPRAVLDLAAANTIIRRDRIPSSVAVLGATMRQASADGVRLLPLSGEGAGGALTGFQTATLPHLQLGSIDAAQVEVMTLQSLPAIGGAPIDAIVGLDVLRRARTVRLTKRSGAEWSLSMGRDVVAMGTPPTATLPLRRVGALVGVDTRVDGHDVFLVLDSGSPFTVISSSVATAAQLHTTPFTGRAPRGLDGRPIAMRDATVSSLRAAAVALTDIPVRVADLPVLAKLGTAHVGLMGSDVLQRFQAIELDFSADVLRLWR